MENVTERLRAQECPLVSLGNLQSIGDVDKKDFRYVRREDEQSEWR